MIYTVGLRYHGKPTPLLPGLNIHQQQQGLNRDDVDPLTVGPGHAQDLEVGEGHDGEAQQKAADVQYRGERREGAQL